MTRAAILDEARKDDGAKARMDLIPAEAMFALGVVLGHGASKYGARNWEHGLDRGRVVAALLRHITAWMGGEDTDPDSGLPHTWHALTNAAILVAHEARDLGLDSRSVA